MEQNLQGKVALVTGGATGIGAAVAVRLAERGADVALTHYSHDPAGVVEAITAVGRRALALKVDVRDSAATTAAVESVVTELGALDIVVNNAGGLVARRPLEETTDEHWHHVVDLNLASAFYVTRAASPHLGTGGRIVSVASLAGQNGGGAGALAYASSKAGMLGFTRALAKEFAPRGITVNAITPGFILDTPFHETFTPAEAQAAAIAATPVGRAGSPRDTAAAIEFLVSDDASFLTGVVIDVNGGTYFS